MKTQRIAGQMEFQGLGKRSVVADFDAGRATSDAGLLLLREADCLRSVTGRVAAACVDHRDPRRVEHPVRRLVAQRLMALAMGYEDVNDHTRLRGDGMLALASGCEDVTGEGRSRGRDRGNALASASTLNRFELGDPERAADHRHRRISVDTGKLDDLLVALFVEAHAEEPEEVVLDIDATDVPLYGDQEGRYYNGYYGENVYLPLYVTCNEHILCCRLRTADREPAHGARGELERVVSRLRVHWPSVRVVVRGDSGFCRDEIMSWCEAEAGVDFVFGLARNVRLRRRIDKAMRKSRVRMLARVRSSRRFREFRYRTRRTWSRKRRVVAKAEWLAGFRGSNARFVVTSLSNRRWGKRELYERLYCGRGDMENRIKDQRTCLYADRLSLQRMGGNQLRLYFSVFAGELYNTVQRLGLRGTRMEGARIDTVRSRLLKTAALVKVSVRRVRVSMSSHSPFRDVFMAVHRNLRAAFDRLHPSPEGIPARPG